MELETFDPVSELDSVDALRDLLRQGMEDSDAAFVNYVKTAAAAIEMHGLDAG
jgi:hypothetical protein